MSPLPRATLAHARRRVLVNRCRFASNANKQTSRDQKRERDYKPVGFRSNTARTQHSTGGLRVALADAQQLREPVDVQRLSQNAPSGPPRATSTTTSPLTAVTAYEPCACSVQVVAHPWDGSQQFT